jgi:glycosyltransferase involved in cell wall biosynthesis
MSKLVSIFAYPSHQKDSVTAGVDFARVIQPMEQLNKMGMGNNEFVVHLWNSKTYPKDMNWDKVAQDHDILYFNYLDNAWGFAMMGMFARKHNRLMVMDLDDDLWNILKDNSSYEGYKQGGEAIKNFTAICNEVDYLTTTNNYLRNLIITNTSKTYDKVKVFPNYIDLNFYKYTPKPRHQHTVWATHFGSTSHFGDLLQPEFVDGVHKVMREFPNFRFRTIGSFLPQFADKWGERYENKFGNADIYKWVNDKYPQFMEDTDFMVVPLRDNVYDRCKSEIKFLEASAAKRCGVWQNIRQYAACIEHGKTGFLAETKEEWYKYIKILTEDKKLRNQMAENAYKSVEKDWTIQQHINDYADFFRGLTKEKEESIR